MYMKTTERKMKFWAKLLSFTLIISMAGGYTSSPVTVEAQQIALKEVTAGETEAEAVTTEPETVEEIDSTTSSAEETSVKETAGGETTSSDVVTEETTTEETTTEEETTTDPDAYTLIAHRGYSGYAPANSMPAFEKAVASGFTTIELDVRRCVPEADGQVKWVISHDDSLKNTMGVDKKISELTYSQILNYSYTKGNGIEAYRNLKIVSYNQIIEMIKKYKNEGMDIIWQIEIKDTDDASYTDYFEDELVKPIVEAELQKNVVFSSFNYTYLKKIKSIDNTIKTWYLNTILNESAINKAKSCGAEGISFKGEANYTTQTDIKEALSEGFRLGCYTIDSPVIMGVYYQWGVRNFATDMLSPIEVYKDMLTGTYNIKAFTATLSDYSYTYDGTRKLPKVKVLYKGIELIEGLNYSLSYTDNKNPGTASVYVSGMNNCIDEQKITYKIVMPKVTDFKITASKTTYIGLSWTKVKNATGYIIYRYNYSKKKYEAIKTLPIVSSSSTVTYKVKNLTSATKYRFRVKAYVVADGKTYQSEACDGKTTHTRSAKTKITYLKRYKGYKRLRVKWAAVPRCTGYNVKIATDKKMKNVVGYYTVKGSKSLKLKIKKLSSSKKYYVKVRSYLKVGDKKFNGVYTDVKRSSKKPKK